MKHKAMIGGLPFTITAATEEEAMSIFQDVIDDLRAAVDAGELDKYYYDSHGRIIDGLSGEVYDEGHDYYNEAKAWLDARQ